MGRHTHIHTHRAEKEGMRREAALWHEGTTLFTDAKWVLETDWKRNVAAKSAVNIHLAANLILKHETKKLRGGVRVMI